MNSYVRPTWCLLAGAAAQQPADAAESADLSAAASDAALWGEEQPGGPQLGQEAGNVASMPDAGEPASRHRAQSA